MDNNSNHRKKMVAPIVITVIIFIYYIFYFSVLLVFMPPVWTFMLGVIPLAFAGVSIYVCIQRINEIRSGEEDDLSKY